MDSPIVKEAKEYFRHEKAPSILQLATTVKGLLQVRVLDKQGDNVRIGLCLVSEDNHKQTLKILGQPQWVKAGGKITLMGAPVDMDFNRLSHEK